MCNGCHGTWYSGQSLAQALKRPVSDLNLDFFSIKPTLFECAQCSHELCDGYLAQIDIHVEHCRQCKGVYLDVGEFKAAKKALQPTTSQPSTTNVSINQDSTLYVEADHDVMVLFQWITGLPIETDSSQRLLAPMLTSLIVINILVFVWMIQQGLEQSIYGWGLIPNQVLAGHQTWTVFTSMFMHANLAHLLGNMYFLFIAGDNLETFWGSVRFLTVYLISGLVAILAHMIFNPSSDLPAVGASGAIAGVFGAYVVLFPNQTMTSRWFYLAYLNVRFDWPAIVYFGFWFLLQFVFVYFDFLGVAWWAHIGGFLAGMALAYLWRDKGPLFG